MMDEYISNNKTYKATQMNTPQTWQQLTEEINQLGWEHITHEIREEKSSRIGDDTLTTQKIELKEHPTKPDRSIAFGEDSWLAIEETTEEIYAINNDIFQKEFVLKQTEQQTYSKPFNQYNMEELIEELIELAENRNKLATAYTALLNATKTSTKDYEYFAEPAFESTLPDHILRHVDDYNFFKMAEALYIIVEEALNRQNDEINSLIDQIIKLKKQAKK
jgi:hypothetical protein